MLNNSDNFLALLAWTWTPWAIVEQIISTKPIQMHHWRKLVFLILNMRPPYYFSIYDTQHHTLLIIN